MPRWSSSAAHAGVRLSGHGPTTPLATPPAKPATTPAAKPAGAARQPAGPPRAGPRPARAPEALRVGSLLDRRKGRRTRRHPPQPSGCCRRASPTKRPPTTSARWSRTESGRRSHSRPIGNGRRSCWVPPARRSSIIAANAGGRSPSAPASGVRSGRSSAQSRNDCDAVAVPGGFLPLRKRDAYGTRQEDVDNDGRDHRQHFHDLVHADREQILDRKRVQLVLLRQRADARHVGQPVHVDPPDGRPLGPMARSRRFPLEGDAWGYVGKYPALP